MERMIKVDENIQTAQNMLSGIVERCYELEEENKKLKSDVSVYKSQRYAYKQKYLALLKANTELEEENRKLREELSKKNMETWFDEKAENVFIDKSGKVIKGGEFTTLC